MNIPYRLTPTSINMLVDGNTHTITEDSHVNYAKIREALRNKEYDSIGDLLNVAQTINQYGEGEITVLDGVVMYGNDPLHNTLTERIIEQIREGFDAQPMIKFLENLIKNPSKRAVDEVYDFLEACDLPITDDGHFVAYKKVRADYKDIYTGRIDNSIGAIPKMLRNKVDEDKNRTCSQGLHFCSESYLQYYGSSEGNRVMIVKVNPMNVVAIPADYRNAKGRACEYEVIGEVDPSKIKFYESSVYSVTNSDSSDDRDDQWDDWSDDFSDDDEDYGYDGTNPNQQSLWDDSSSNSSTLVQAPNYPSAAWPFPAKPIDSSQSNGDANNSNMIDELLTTKVHCTKTQIASILYGSASPQNLIKVDEAVLSGLVVVTNSVTGAQLYYVK